MLNRAVDGTIAGTDGVIAAIRQGHATMMEAVKRILVVDGEKEFANTITRHLKRKKFRLQAAHNGKDALAKIQATTCPVSQYDLVITDVIIPKVSGIALLEWIKKYRSQISVLIVSGLGHKKIITDTIRPEMDGYCQKPVTPFEMMHLIDTINDKRRAHALHQS